MRILLYGRYMKDKHKDAVTRIVQSALSHDMSLYANAAAYQYLRDIDLSDDIPRINTTKELADAKVDVVMTLGGDGTILEATNLIGALEIPILGVNLGRLGFLANVEQQYIERSLQQLLDHQYSLEDRTMIHLESSLTLFGDAPFALNDFTLHKRDTSSMITIHTYINGDYLNSYWADGLIVATPTGSTGYSLSCGGPIVFPNSGNFIITPVAPHNLNVRPLVISDESVISFEIEGRSESFLCTLDSRFETITSRHQLAVRKCHHHTKLITLKDHSFMKTIHEKLSWGADNRN